MKINILFVLLAITFKSFAQHCWPASASVDLDVNNIRAKLLNGGDMWWDGASNPGYEYPKIDPSTGAIPKHILFAGAIWMTGLDANGDLKCAGQTYRNQGHDFWPGPIVYGTSTVPDTECTKFDRFFPIYRTELEAHINAINNTNSPLLLANMEANILEWPAKGNQYLLDQYNIEVVDDLAPFEDCNNNGIYDPENGDYPLMKGDQSIFWVLNDLGNVHGRSGGDPLGVEIQCMAYAYITNDAVNDATFYDYKIIKKTSGNLNEFYFSQFVDPDLGIPTDDFIGCDTSFNYGFCYNSTNIGNQPIVITQFLKSPSQGLSSFVPFYNSAGSQSDPGNAAEFRNYQTGRWKDGMPITCAGTGYGGTTPAAFVFPGNPADTTAYIGCQNWTECSVGNTPGDRRYVMSSGPYTLNATDALEFTLAVMAIPTNPMTYNGCPDKNTLINPVVNSVNAFINSVNENPYNCKMLSSIVSFQDKGNLVSIFPNPTQDVLNVEVHNDFKISSIELIDAKGSVSAVNLKNKSINLSNKAKGIYTLKIYSNEVNKIVLKKFVLR